MLLQHLRGVVVERVSSVGSAVVIEARAAAAAVACPGCGSVSRRVHGRYRRRLADAAIAGAAVVIELLVRRFRCVDPGCSVVTFVEQVEGLTRPYGRYTPVLEAQLTAVGLALAGRAGVRLAGELGIAVGRDTLLRRVRALSEPPIGQVAVLGVDDFAFRRGRKYGTVMVDMTTRRPIDMIDSRDGDALAAWLGAHPGVEVICRDRAGGYGEGARAGAPHAIQVADRFHLWRNLGMAVEKTINTRRANLAEPTQAPSTTAPEVVQPVAEKKIVTRFRVHYTAVQELRAQGLSLAAIGRKLGLHQATVRKYAHARCVEDLIAKNQTRALLVDDYVEYLHQRWHEGERNATQLFREISARGYPGGELAVQRYLRRYRHHRGHAQHVGPKPPSVREVTSWVMTRPDRLRTDPATALTGIRARDADLDRVTRHVRAFAAIMVGRRGHRIDDWITAVEADTLPPLAAFARNLRRDLDAVRHGLTLPHNSGPVEGNINRIKMLKRQMFGRANLDLLRKRVLLTR